MVGRVPEQAHVAFVRLDVIDDFGRRDDTFTLVEFLAFVAFAQGVSCEEGFRVPLPARIVTALGGCAAWLMGLALADLVAVRLHVFDCR